MGTPQERETLAGLLRFDGEPRNDLPFQGLEYEAIKETVERSVPAYLERWSCAIAEDRPAHERASRAIAAQLLDIGFHSDYLHHWWTWRTKNPRDVETPLADVVAEAVTIHLPLLHNPVGPGIRLPVAIGKLRRTIREAQARFSGFNLSLMLGWCREDGLWDPALRIEADAEFVSGLSSKLDSWKRRLEDRFVQRSIYMRISERARWL